MARLHLVWAACLVFMSSFENTNGAYVVGSSDVPIPANELEAAVLEFTSADGRFKVQMPGTPKEGSQASGGATMKTYSIESRNGAYVVGYADLPIPANEPEAAVQERLDGARDGAVRGGNATLSNSYRITLAGKYPGREFSATLNGTKGILRAKVYLVKGRLYQVMVIGTDSFANSSDSRQFLDSFALTQ
jgi:hypothetical protein